MNSSYHVPVLLEEIVELLNPQEGEIFIDGTLGGGGHSEAIAEKVGESGKLIAIDQDLDAIEAGKRRLDKFGDRVEIVYDNFVNISEIVKNRNLLGIDGILLDLGVSSHQIDEPDRGFSYNEKSLNARLDMRMNQEQQLSAYDVVNFYPEKKLKQIFWEYGEESSGAQIARTIVYERDKKKVETVGDLVEIIKKATPPKYRFSKGGNQWASNVFRAIRMEVNQELPVIEAVLPQVLGILNKGGRLAVISFHSLEDRIIKDQFREWESSGLVENLTPKPIVASNEEISENPRSKSARLRVIKKL